MSCNFKRTGRPGYTQRTARIAAVWEQVIWGEGRGTRVPGKETRRSEGGRTLSVVSSIWTTVTQDPADPAVRTRTEWGGSHRFKLEMRKQFPWLCRVTADRSYGHLQFPSKSWSVPVWEHGSDYSQDSRMTWQLRFLPILWFENLLQIVPSLCKSLKKNLTAGKGRNASSLNSEKENSCCRPGLPSPKLLSFIHTDKFSSGVWGGSKIVL